MLISSLLNNLQALIGQNSKKSEKMKGEVYMNAFLALTNLQPEDSGKFMYMLGKALSEDKAAIKELTYDEKYLVTILLSNHADDNSFDQITKKIL